MYDVVGVDTPNIDLVLNFEKFPQPNGFSLVQQSSWQGGGKVATGLVAAARLGAKGAILGTVGDDLYGRFIQKDFAVHGVDTAGLLVRQGASSSMATVLSDAESCGRCIAWQPGTAPVLSIEEIPKPYFTDTKYFFIAGTSPLALECARRARAAGAKVLVDLDHEMDNVEECLATTDILVASEFVYERLCPGVPPQEACQALAAKGPQIAVFTFGEKGCAGFGPEGGFHLPAYNVRAVDTVGAGDVFHGAFVAGLLQGKSAQETARFASAVSAIKCTRIGGRAGIPNRETTLHFMETGQILAEELDARVTYYARGLNHV